MDTIVDMSNYNVLIMKINKNIFVMINLAVGIMGFCMKINQKQTFSTVYLNLYAIYVYKLSVRGAREPYKIV